jgi:hypothetical protein
MQKALDEKKPAAIKAFVKHDSAITSGVKILEKFWFLSPTNQTDDKI